MTKKRCRIKIVQHPQDIWRLRAPKECIEIFEEINKRQGPYAKKYLMRRVEFVKEEA